MRKSDLFPTPSPWLPDAEKTRSGLPALFCFACAGGSAEPYRQWQHDLDGIAQVIPVELPGRGRRMGEPPSPNLSAAAEEAAGAMAQCLPGRFFFFGHSLGSIVALEAARVLSRDYCRHPAALFVSGRYPPHIETYRREFHKGPDEDLMNEIRRLGGTSEEVLQTKEFAEVFLPIVRDDFRLLETHRADRYPLLDVPVHVCCGDADDDSSQERLQRWNEITSKTCTVQLFPGGHFYLHDPTALIRHLAKKIEESEE